LKIYILVDNPNSWIMPYATDLSERLTQNNHDLYLVDNQSKIEHCEIAFYLGCTSIVKREVMDLSNSNVVVHPSALRKRAGVFFIGMANFRRKKHYHSNSI